MKPNPGSVFLLKKGLETQNWQKNVLYPIKTIEANASRLKLIAAKSGFVWYGITVAF